VDDLIYIVAEGHGEKEAAPVLIRRLLYEEHQRYEFRIEVYRTSGNNYVISPGGLENILEAVRRIEGCKGVIVLLDAESQHCDCPPTLAYSLAERAKESGLGIPVVVVCPTCEYESWFLTSIHKMGKWLLPGATFEGDPETMQNVKQWLTNHRPKGDPYRETVHQVKMTIAIDIPHTITHSRSFRRMAHAVEELLEAMQTDTPIVTPMKE
jgi:hypothetical protein